MYPSHQIYEVLYKRFLNPERTEALVNVIDCKDKMVLDLCCGNGRLTELVLSKGAKSVIMVDECRKMIPDKWFGLNVMIRSVHAALKDIKEQSIDIIFCQQGIGNWLNSESGKLLYRVLTENGKLVFNTFHKKPKTIPVVRQYIIDGLSYVESSQLINKKVHHVQVCEGYEPHVTSFDWLSKNDIKFCLREFFKIKYKIEGSSIIYRCSRRKKT